MCQTLIGKSLRKEDGASVVEVAVIVPMIWIIVMGFVLFFFFLLDMGVVKSETIRMANEISMEWRTEEKQTVSIPKKKQVLKERLNQRLSLAQINSTEISISFEKVSVKAEVTFFLGGKGLSFSNEGKATMNYREKWVRILYKKP